MQIMHRETRRRHSLFFASRLRRKLIKSSNSRCSCSGISWQPFCPRGEEGRGHLLASTGCQEYFICNICWLNCDWLILSQISVIPCRWHDISFTQIRTSLATGQVNPRAIWEMDWDLQIMITLEGTGFPDRKYCTVCVCTCTRVFSLSIGHPGKVCIIC